MEPRPYKLLRFKRSAKRIPFVFTAFDLIGHLNVVGMAHVVG